jgi:hypothetical protein
MSTAVTTCPKCAHVRAPADFAPEWQCPRCGIAYAKFQPKPSAAPPPAAPAAVRGPLDPASPGALVDRAPYADQAFSYSFVSSPAMAYIGVLFVGIAFQEREIWLAVLSICATASFVCWYRALTKKRLTENVPTSRIASAAQGYVEIKGTIEKAPGCTVTGALSGAPCVWYRYKISEASRESDGDSSKVFEQGGRAVPFILRDETGECLVDPDGVAVTCPRTYSQAKDRRRYSEWALKPGDPVYVIGNFTSGTAPGEGAPDHQVRALIRKWLERPPEFVKRFDADGDRRVSAAELARAHEAARAELTGRAVAQGGVHALADPGDGRPFLIYGSQEHDHITAGLGQEVRQHFTMFAIMIGFFAYNL